MTYTVYWNGVLERQGLCPSLLAPRPGGSSLSIDQIVKHGDSEPIEWSPKEQKSPAYLRTQIRAKWQRQRRRSA